MGKGKSLDDSHPDSSSASPGNYIIGYATMTGYKSYLRSDSEEGSVWMPLLAEELQCNPDRDVLNVLQDVNSRLSNDYTMKRIELDSFQQPHFESTCPEKVNLFKISGKQLAVVIIHHSLYPCRTQRIKS